MLQPGIGSHCKKGKENKEIKDWGRGKRTFGACNLFKM
jgi:hypothetical protein